MNSTFTGIFSLMIYGIAKHSIDHGGMSGWRVINLFLGACTVFAGIMALIFLGSPDEGECSCLPPNETAGMKLTLISSRGQSSG